MRRDVFQAIADPTRRGILARIASHAMTPNALADEFHTTRQAVSKHIKILAECQLLIQEKSGREIYYHLNPEKMREIDEWLDQFKSLWMNRFERLDALLNPLKQEKNES